MQSPNHTITDQFKGYLNLKTQLQAFTQVLQPGEYSIPISIVLPEDLPGSLSYVDPRFFQYSHLSYMIKSKLKDDSGLKLIEAKRVLIITERPQFSISESKQEKEFKLQSFWCIDQGTHKLSLEVDNNQEPYTFDDKISCRLFIDNSKCNQALLSISLSLMSEMYMTDEDGQPSMFNCTRNWLTKSSYAQLPANTRDHEARVFELDLSSYRYQLKDQNKEERLGLTSEVMNFAKRLPTTHNSDLVKNNYRLRAQIHHTGCNCSLSFSVVTVPILIIPELSHKELEKHNLPHGFNPIQLQPMKYN
eukprot:403340019